VPGCKLLQTRRLQGGLSADMTLLTIKRNDGREQQMILRQLSAATFARQPDAAINEFRLLELLHLNGLPTPVPYYLDQSGEILPTPYLVVEYIPGEVDFSPSDLKGRILQMAEQLAHIHSIDLSGTDCSFLVNASSYCDEALNEQVSASDPGMDLDRVVEVLQSHDKTVKRNLPVLLHGDFWPGNILWQSGHLEAIIDWEDAQLGDPLIDLAISRLDLLWIFGTEAMLLFTHHYDSMAHPDLTNLPYWDLCAALRLARLVASDLAGWAAFFQPYGRQDISGESIRISCRLFIDQALSKLE
jgi:aminoglycoside phosphotransferase (APT) family kinase protein